VLRLFEFVHAPYYALFMVGPVAVLTEIYLRRQATDTPTPAAPAKRMPTAV